MPSASTRTRRRPAVLAGLLLTAALLVSCSSDGDSEGVVTGDQPGATSTTAADTSSDAGTETTAASGTDSGASDAISVPETPADAEGCRTPEEAAQETEGPEPVVPTEAETAITIVDEIPGCGDLVGPDSTIAAHYVLSTLSAGGLVQSSWEGGDPFEATLGRGELIPGWDTAIPGMRAGGRRILTIGPEYGYGDLAQGPGIEAGETLSFVIDVISVS